MKSRFHRFAVLLAGGLCLACPFAWAGNPFPDGYPVERYAPLWEHSPFTIASVQQAAPQAGFAQNLAVVGIAKIGNEDMVTLVNKQTQEHITLSSDADVQGIKLMGVVADSDPLKTKVTIQKGSEVATIGFDRALLGVTQSPAARQANVLAAQAQARAQAAANPPSDDSPPPHDRQSVRLPPIPGVDPKATASLNQGAVPTR